LKFRPFGKRKKSGRNVIRKKLLLFFFITFIIVNTISLFTYNTTRVLTGELNDIFSNDSLLTDLSTTLDSVESSLKAYLTTSRSSDLYDYLNASNELRDMSLNLKPKLSDNESDLLLSDIKNLMITYLETTDFAVQEKRGRDIAGYTEQFNKATQVYDYANDYIDKLKIYEFKENNTYYVQASERLASMQVFNIAIIILATVVDFVLIILFSYSVAEPIIRLSKAASEIAQGNYDVPPVEVHSNDEVKTLALSFNHMAESIKRQVVENQEKTRIENCLKEQEMQNLKMKSMLNEVELRSLQAQINPHFMFNTLNAALQLAMFEGANRTQLFLENFSGLLRYNLGNIRIPSTLMDEIGNVESYVYLLNERYGNKISFTKEVEEGIFNVEMPRMTLQPIVENSFIHGINTLESGGQIKVAAHRAGQTVRVEISDNGRGMSRETIEQILAGRTAETAEHREKDGWSIGLKNVISRLMLFYRIEEVNKIIEIKSKEQVGTCVALILPIREQGGSHV
jgi:two-component system sensor histidine kinase YesM